MTFTTVLNMSISASWLVLAIIVLRFALKKAPKALHCALWVLVAVRLLCPVSIESPLSLVPTGEIVPEEYLSMEPRDDMGQTATLDIVTNPVYPEAVELELSTPIGSLQTQDVLWTLAWWTGMGVMALYALFSYLSLRLRVRCSVRLKDNIWLCDEISSPFILGIIRPRIYLPSTLEQRRIPYVVAHEKAHLKRLDHWWKPLGFLLLTVHWFNPVMWAAYCLLCRDIELACDERVIRDMDKASVRQYSEALVACSVPQRSIAACPLAFGEVGVKERVKSMLSYKKPGFWIMLIALVLCVVLIVCFMTDPAASTIGNLNDEHFEYLFLNVEEMYLSYGEFSKWENGSDEGLIQLVEGLKAIKLNPNPVNRSLDEGRDRTYEIYVSGSSTLCVSADFSEVWIDDGVKPSYSYAVKEPETLKALLGEYIPAIPSESITWAGNELDRIIYQDGYRITGQEEAEITARLDVNALPADIYTGEGYTFGENELVVYRNGATTVFLSHIGFDDPEQEYLICTFDFRYELAGQGGVILPYRVNTVNGVTESFSTGLGFLSKNIPDAETVHEDGAYFRGSGPNEKICVNIRTAVMKAAKDYLEFTVMGLQELSYVREESLEGMPVFSGTYVPYQCLYMNSLSSYFSFGGDSGCVYHFGDSSFTIETRSGSVMVYDPIAWNWQTINWEDEPFRELAEQDISMLDSPSLKLMVGDNARYQMLDGQDFLLYDDGQLMLVDTMNLNRIGLSVWCIYMLVPEASMGFAEWVFQPMSSFPLPGFRFEFDMEYTSITATTVDGLLISFDEPSITGYPSGTDLTIPEGKALYWAPGDENGQPVEEGTILFSVHNGEQTVYNGTIYITSSPVTDLGERIYTARIIGTGLHVEPNEVDSGAVIGTTSIAAMTAE